LIRADQLGENAAPVDVRHQNAGRGYGFGQSEVAQVVLFQIHLATTAGTFEENKIIFAFEKMKRFPDGPAQFGL